jgi:hypothetical protein
MSAAPPPSPPPLRTITTVHASPFCGTFEKSVAPAFSAVSENEKIVIQGRQLLVRMAQPSAQSYSAVRLGQLAGAVAHNLEAVNAALKSLATLPNPPQTVDERHLLQLRDLLSAMAGRQQRMLDVMSGTSASFTSSELYQRANPIPMTPADADALSHPRAVDAPPAGEAYNALAFYERQEESLQPLAAQAIFESRARCR